MERSSEISWPPTRFFALGMVEGERQRQYGSALDRMWKFPPDDAGRFVAIGCWFVRMRIVHFA